MSRAESGERGGYGEGCDRIRESVAALLNGTDPACFPGEIDDHLRSCEACRVWEAEAIAVHNRNRGASSHHAVLSSRQVSDPRRVLQLRYALGIIAATELAPGIIWFMAAVGGPTVESARGVVAAEVAFALVCLLASLQPRRARRVLPVGVGLTVLVLGISVADVARGMSAPLDKSHAAVELAGTAMLALLAGRTDRASRGGAGPGQGP